MGKEGLMEWVQKEEQRRELRFTLRCGRDRKKTRDWRKPPKMERSIITANRDIVDLQSHPTFAQGFGDWMNQGNVIIIDLDSLIKKQVIPELSLWCDLEQLSQMLISILKCFLNSKLDVVLLMMMNNDDDCYHPYSSSLVDETEEEHIQRRQKKQAQIISNKMNKFHRGEGSLPRLDEDESSSLFYQGLSLIGIVEHCLDELRNNHTVAVGGDSTSSISSRRSSCIELIRYDNKSSQNIGSLIVDYICHNNNNNNNGKSLFGVMTSDLDGLFNWDLPCPLMNVDSLQCEMDSPHLDWSCDFFMGHSIWKSIFQVKCSSEVSLGMRLLFEHFLNDQSPELSSSEMINKAKEKAVELYSEKVTTDLQSEEESPHSEPMKSKEEDEGGAEDAADGDDSDAVVCSSSKSDEYGKFESFVQRVKEEWTKESIPLGLLEFVDEHGLMDGYLLSKDEKGLESLKNTRLFRKDGILVLPMMMEDLSIDNPLENSIHGLLSDMRRALYARPSVASLIESKCNGRIEEWMMIIKQETPEIVDTAAAAQDDDDDADECESGESGKSENGDKDCSPPLSKTEEEKRKEEQCFVFEKTEVLIKDIINDPKYSDRPLAVPSVGSSCVTKGSSKTDQTLSSTETASETTNTEMVSEMSDLTITEEGKESDDDGNEEINNTILNKKSIWKFDGDDGKTRMIDALQSLLDLSLNEMMRWITLSDFESKFDAQIKALKIQFYWRNHIDHDLGLQRLNPKLLDEMDYRLNDNIPRMIDVTFQNLWICVIKLLCFEMINDDDDQPPLHLLFNGPHFHFVCQSLTNVRAHPHLIADLNAMLAHYSGQEKTRLDESKTRERRRRTDQGRRMQWKKKG